VEEGHAKRSIVTFVEDWIATAKHPKYKEPFTAGVDQPVLELMACLRANGFKTFIVSGGGIEFMRPWTEKVYGLPPEQMNGGTQPAPMLGNVRIRFVGGASPRAVLPSQLDAVLLWSLNHQPSTINLFSARRSFAPPDGDTAKRSSRQRLICFLGIPSLSHLWCVSFSKGIAPVREPVNHRHTFK
jgi:hypothetical protein